MIPEASPLDRWQTGGIWTRRPRCKHQYHPVSKVSPIAAQPITVTTKEFTVCAKCALVQEQQGNKKRGAGSSAVKAFGLAEAKQPLHQEALGVEGEQHGATRAVRHLRAAPSLSMLRMAQKCRMHGPFCWDPQLQCATTAGLWGAGQIEGLACPATSASLSTWQRPDKLPRPASETSAAACSCLTQGQQVKPLASQPGSPIV